MPDRHDDRDMTMDSVKFCKRFKIKIFAIILRKV